ASQSCLSAWGASATAITGAAMGSKSARRVLPRSASPQFAAIADRKALGARIARNPSRKLLAKDTACDMELRRALDLIGRVKRTPLHVPEGSSSIPIVGEEGGNVAMPIRRIVLMTVAAAFAGACSSSGTNPGGGAGSSSNSGGSVGAGQGG